MSEKGIGYAKTILLGEHFVVYGIPAIAIGLPRKLEVEIQNSDHMQIVPNSDEKVVQSMEAIKKAMNITDNFIIKIKSEIPLGCGLGSSAALCVGFVRALSNKYKLNLSNELISSYAYEGEKIYHKTPSGIDNTLATFGGAILFQKAPEKNIIKPLKIGAALFIVIGNTGKRIKGTGEIVADVRAKKEKNPELYAYLFDAEKKIIELALNAIEQGKVQELGELMNVNQGLLSAIGVSSKENEEIIQKARECGALGAKLTGAGLGGCCVILAENKKNAELIVNEIKKIGYNAFSIVVEKN